MKKLVICIVFLIGTIQTWSQSELNNLLSNNPWRGFISQEVDGWGTITTSHYMKVYFDDPNVQMDGYSHAIYGTREITLPYEDEYGYTTNYSCKVNFTGSFNAADQTFTIHDTDFIYKNDLPGGLYFMLDQFKVTIYIDQDNNQFMLLKGYQLDDSGYTQYNTDVFFTTDPSYSPWSD
jgi:hypothetical protein